MSIEKIVLFALAYKANNELKRAKKYISDKMPFQHSDIVSCAIHYMFTIYRDCCSKGFDVHKLSDELYGKFSESDIKIILLLQEGRNLMERSMKYGLTEDDDNLRIYRIVRLLTQRALFGRQADTSMKTKAEMQAIDAVSCYFEAIDYAKKTNSFAGDTCKLYISNMYIKGFKLENPDASEPCIDF